MAAKSSSFFNHSLVLIVFLFVVVLASLYFVAPSKEKFYDKMNTALLPTDKIQVMQGVQIPDKLPQQPIVFDQLDPSMPSVDGSKAAPKSLFMMTYNDVRPECCDYSPYSTSSGCVCLTKDQISFVGSRGFNNRPDKCGGLAEI